MIWRPWEQALKYLWVQGIITHMTDVKPLISVATYIDDDTGIEIYQPITGTSFRLGKDCCCHNLETVFKSFIKSFEHHLLSYCKEIIGNALLRVYCIRNFIYKSALSLRIGANALLSKKCADSRQCPWNIAWCLLDYSCHTWIVKCIHNRRWDITTGKISFWCQKFNKDFEHFLLPGKTFQPLDKAPDQVTARGGNKKSLMLQTHGSKFVQFQEVKIQEMASEVGLCL